ncbi:MAG: Thymidylate synthase ThyX [Candidatus Woesebacteria bacterium GW2011_GWB1_45_5]|uniref:Flavin-dependent thymidylate synthase n=1 Tax=Candidatus Woesebacteria bacterium GW2011_GWB1_45_5 TaxID=1618581 RepID=A0A0G1PXI5_9BACT|nr:MAG: Thymidylate synthase ThyX [Candidatus Woesebacteria bacterium GW2011_GWB1_45_5]
MKPERNRIELSVSQTKRTVSPGAEKWLGIPIEVLDKGFVYLVDYMGDDAAIEQAARTSYGRGTRSVNQMEGLIRYLRRHRHTTPFEMGEMKFHARMPISVARQWVRHRTASLNEYSARYSIVPDDFYVPSEDVISVQSTNNRQGRGESVDPGYAKDVIKIWEENGIRSYEEYKFLINDDGTGKPIDPGRPQIARELARNVLPVDYYTEWYWKTDLHNLFHFLGLRMDTHAQWEIRQYADTMAKIVDDAFPLSWKAFEDYELFAVNLSLPEQKILSNLVEGRELNFSKAEILSAATSTGLTNKRETQEVLEKFEKLGFIK